MQAYTLGGVMEHTIRWTALGSETWDQPTRHAYDLRGSVRDGCMQTLCGLSASHCRLAKLPKSAQVAATCQEYRYRAWRIVNPDLPYPA